MPAKCSRPRSLPRCRPRSRSRSPESRGRQQYATRSRAKQTLTDASSRSRSITRSRSIKPSQNEMLNQGLSQNLPDCYFDLDQLTMGTQVEFEHTNDRVLAKKIAKDHLVEFPDYYSRLKRMEEEAKKYWTSERYEKTLIGQYLMKK